MNVVKDVLPELSLVILGGQQAVVCKIQILTSVSHDLVQGSSGHKTKMAALGKTFACTDTVQALYRPGMGFVWAGCTGPIQALYGLSFINLMQANMYGPHTGLVW